MLVSVVSEFNDELNGIQAAFHGPRARSPVESAGVLPYWPLDDGCLVSLWDSWNRFMREVCLASAAGRVTGASGRAYSPATLRDEDAALAELHQYRSVKGSGLQWSKNEPKWFDPRTTEAACAYLELENSGAIRDALSQATIDLGGGFAVDNPVVEIRSLRNWTAHKSRAEFATLAASYQWTWPCVSERLRSSSRGGSTVFDDWIEALRALAWDTIL